MILGFFLLFMISCNKSVPSRIYSLAGKRNKGRGNQVLRYKSSVSATPNLAWTDILQQPKEALQREWDLKLSTEKYVGIEMEEECWDWKTWHVQMLWAGNEQSVFQETIFSLYVIFPFTFTLWRTFSRLSFI